MKTMKSTRGKIVRVSDEKASRLYEEGYTYISKEEWKKHIKGINDEVHNHPLGTEFSYGSIKKKSNKLSKAQKRHMRKTL